MNTFQSGWRRTLVLAGFCVASQAWPAGTWSNVGRLAPGSVNTMILLSDGTVFATDGGDSWFRLTPDQHGSYVNGTWTKAASMHDTRLYFSSDVLPDGRVFIAGGEDGTGTSSAEIYDPLLNNWTLCASSGGQLFSDSISTVLPNGNVLVAPVWPSQYGRTAIYNPATDTWPLFPVLVNGFDQAEASWVKLPDFSILTVDPYGQLTERFIPSRNGWVNDSTVPVELYDSGDELGPAFLLANGKAFFIGASGKTALYTPSGTSLPGKWAAGPVFPNGLGAPDAPAAMMANGRILCAVVSDSTGWPPPTEFFEYDSVSNSLELVEGPGQVADNLQPYYCRMLDLPDGTVLFSVSSSQLYDYQPAGAPLPAGRPAIGGITMNYYRSYHLTGTLLNGISQGAAFGDDAQMDSNYPLVRLTDSNGIAYYARTHNWSSTSVMTGSTPISTDFMVPQNLPAGAYSLVVVANGNSSAPVSFNFLPDALQIAPFSGFSASGPTGGPIPGKSVSYSLTNTGTSSVNWSAGDTPNWLNISATNGTLNPGDSPSTVTVSLNTTAASNISIGNYKATIWFTNLTTEATQSVPFSYQSTSLIVNGGFETGSTAFWQLSGDPGMTQTGNTGTYSHQTQYIHSGSYAALLGENTPLGYLSQAIPTVSGQYYHLSFWLDNVSGVTTNVFLVSWNGSVLFNESTLGHFAFTNFQFNVLGAANSSVLRFGFFNATNFFGLDSITLQPVPTPSFVTYEPSAGTIDLGWSAMPGLNYQVQYTSDPALNQWSNLGGAITAPAAVATATDTLTNTQRFYRVLLLP
jgi:hypothetical protein